MDHPTECRDEAGEESGLAPWLEKTALKLVPFLAVAVFLYLFLTQGVLIALTAFLWFVLLYYLVTLFFRAIKKFRKTER